MTKKRTGPDWIVDVLIIAENEVYPTKVFGAADEAEAVRDALSSFVLRTLDELQVIKVEPLR